MKRCNQDKKNNSYHLIVELREKNKNLPVLWHPSFKVSKQLRKLLWRDAH